MKRADVVIPGYQTDATDTWVITGLIGDQAAVTRLCDDMHSVFALSDLHPAAHPRLEYIAHVLACLNPAHYDAKHGDGAHAADLAAIQAAAHQETP